MAQLLLSVMGAFAEFDRSLIRERQREGVALAKARGAYRGRKRTLTDKQIADLRGRVAVGEPKARLAREFDISRETVYQYLRAHGSHGASCAETGRRLGVSGHIFLDESKERGYIIVAGVLLPEDLAAARKTMRTLVMPGQRRVHFYKGKHRQAPPDHRDNHRDRGPRPDLHQQRPAAGDRRPRRLFAGRRRRRRGARGAHARARAGRLTAVVGPPTIVRADPPSGVRRHPALRAPPRGGGGTVVDPGCDRLVLVALQPPQPWPAPPRRREPLGSGYPVAATRAGVAGQLPAHRRRAPADLGGDQPRTHPGPVQVRNHAPLVLGQVAGTDGLETGAEHRWIVQDTTGAGGDAAPEPPPGPGLARTPRQGPDEPAQTSRRPTPRCARSLTRDRRQTLVRTPAPPRCALTAPPAP